MSHFNFEKTVNELTRLDGPLQKAPLMRWQRKAKEADLRLTMPSASGDVSCVLSPSKPRSAKTPATPLSAKLPCHTFTPCKTPKSAALTKTPRKTPMKSYGDRFIPNRSTTNFEMGHYALTRKKESADANEEEEDSDVYQQLLNSALTNGVDPHKAKILSYKGKAPPQAEGISNNLKVLYSSVKCAGPKVNPTRQVPKVPERILDAPDLRDDYYLNLLDWSHRNLLLVALGNAVYLWNATEGSISQLCELPYADDYFSSIRCIEKGDYVALGTSSGSVMLFDIGTEKHIRTMSGHSARVGALDWNTFILSSGSRCGAIHHHDVRVAEHHVGTLSSHTQEVCGLKWSPDKRYLASGANDNMLYIWNATLGHDIKPLYSLSEHQSSVKAISWCSWQPSLLASGGGLADRYIRFWNMSTGTCLNAVNTHSQVCSILWSKEHRELISGHGYSQNQLSLWKYPSMSKVADLMGHSARILYMALSPDGTTVASAGADETIRLWKCFENIKQAKAPTKTSGETSTLSILKKIR
ncbi:hypothetical protein SNE40_015883 [Patella caerulea]|uniref:CDC20/Fizzy WD40 domain-containing protein n=1 Tax=Patella caerulea TaxID=87958 RepID=A0AAN8J7Q9_PATCE